jgi:hypothetical protein
MAEHGTVDAKIWVQLPLSGSFIMFVCYCYQSLTKGAAEIEAARAVAICVSTSDTI